MISRYCSSFITIGQQKRQTQPANHRCSRGFRSLEKRSKSRSLCKYPFAPAAHETSSSDWSEEEITTIQVPYENLPAARIFCNVSIPTHPGIFKSSNISAGVCLFSCNHLIDASPLGHVSMFSLYPLSL